MKKLFIMMLFFFSSITYAKQFAAVISNRAIIYSDINLESPIGYVNKGKRLVVGSVKRRRESVVPIIVSGKIAFIQIKDLDLSEKYQVQNAEFLEHDPDDVSRFFNEVDIAKPKLFLTLNAGTFELGNEWSTFTTELGEESADNANLLTIGIESRNEFTFRTIGMYVQQFGYSTNDLDVKAYFLGFNIDYSLFKLGILSFDLGFKVFGTPSFDISQTSAGLESGTTAYGANLGLVLKAWTYDKYGLFVGAHYNYLKLSEIENFETSANPSKLSGTNLLAGLSINI